MHGIEKACKEKKISDYHVTVGQNVHKKWILSEKCFSFELGTYPASLFDKHGLIRESGKHQLAKYLGDQCQTIT